MNGNQPRSFSRWIEIGFQLSVALTIINCCVDITGDPKEWKNIAVAEYYGLKTIRFAESNGLRDKNDDALNNRLSG